MKQHGLVKRLAMAFLPALVVASVLLQGSFGKQVYAEDSFGSIISPHNDSGKEINSLGTTAIKAPPALQESDTYWKGSYVWFGKYDGEPVKYRVLEPNTTRYGGSTMLLDCDSILYKAPYDVNGIDKVNGKQNDDWTNSDIRANLNGSSFLMKQNGFTSVERAAIAGSIRPHEPYDEEGGYLYFSNQRVARVEGEKVFLLDVDDIAEAFYCYNSDKLLHYDIPAKIKYYNGTAEKWWLRATASSFSKSAGAVDETGCLTIGNYSETWGVSPAINIDLSSVIFTECVRGRAWEDGAEYKLTVKDSDIRLALSGSMPVYNSGNKVTTYYTLSGENAAKCTRMSVLILDREYQPGNSNKAQIFYYGKMDLAPEVLQGSSLVQNYMVSFDLPEGFAMVDWNEAYYVYMLAEIENGYHETDYACEPVLMSSPSTLIIREQPADVSTKVASFAEFSVIANGEGITYQWQSRRDASSSWANYEEYGAQTDRLRVAVAADLNGWQFRCIVKSADGKQIITRTAKLTVALNFHSQPKDPELNAGEEAHLFLGATGANPLSYQWQSRKNASYEWTNSAIAGAKTNYLSFPVTAGFDGWQFRCIVTDGNGKKLISRTISLSVCPIAVPKIKVHNSVRVGETATFEVTAEGPGTLKYQWQSRKNESAPWSNSAQSGAKTAKLSVVATAGLNGWQFRCLITDGKGNTRDTLVLTLFVSPRISSNPANVSVTVGEKATFSVVADGKEPLKYQWQSRKDDSASWANSAMSGAKTPTLTVPATAGLNGWQFRCLVTDGNGRVSYSSEAKLTIIPEITKQPKSKTVSAGKKATFTVEATGVGPLRYQWQSRKDSSASWTNSAQSGAKTSTLTVATTAGLNGWQFRCIVKDANGKTVKTKTVTLTVN
ncbi:MAG: immunoglobulin domain-containing protein [Lachnospiraceae bacterium]|nr:immunoglobulin domain-containing protein [Lachnospiraceae bacterium]